jgi:hypothetical protein
MTRLSDFLAHAILDRPYPHRKAPRRATGATRRGPTRGEGYKAWIRTLPCLVCHQTPSEAAHTGRDGGTGQKASDSSCVPLCALHHTVGGDSYHQVGRVRFARRFRLNLEDEVKRLNQEWAAVQTIARAG